MSEGEKIIPINIEEEMKTAYIDYSMSVIVSRALPDVRDGLKPVHRRVLYGMSELGVAHNKAHKKSARIVGEVLGKYHPHGDTSVYDTMVRMAQEWSLRYPMVDGQGNFGSVDGDSPAAMRYTEARLQKIAEEMLKDLDKETVDFRLNFDDTLEEPTVLPAKIPNLLVNGASGIAVGMATNMLPHNISEVIDGTVAYIDNKEIEIEELITHIKAPDFPTGGTIYGYSGVKSAFETGRGKVVVRGKATIEPMDSGLRDRIIVTEIPYQVNKSSLIIKTAELVNDKKIEGISDIRDESDRNGMRIVYELKRDAIPNVVLNHLYKYTQLQTSYGVNNIVLVKGRPMLLNVKEMIGYFVEHRHEIVVKRTEYELRKAEEKAHILEGLIIAQDNIDEVIKLIRASKTPEEARTGLMTKFSLSEIQARAILDMRLQKLTGLEIDKLKKEYAEIMEFIAECKDILGNEERRMQIIKDELIEMKEAYGDDRRSNIEYSSEEFSIEDMIPNEEVVVTISHEGYVKRTSLEEYKVQNRGGRGSKGSKTRDKDFIEEIFVASTHNYLLFFTEKGRCFWLRVFEVPEGAKATKGRPIQNLINIPSDDSLKAFINVTSITDEDYINNHHVVFCTKKGQIKKTILEAYSRPRVNGVNAITINEGDELLGAKLSDGQSHILMAAQSGKCIHFPEEKVRPMGRTAAGVRGMTTAGPEDELVGMVVVNKEQMEEYNILVVSEQGYGKRSDIEDYRITNRGGKGVKTISITDKTGQLIAIKAVKDDNDLMIINKSGITIRMHVDAMRVMGRNTQGVRLIKLGKNDEIAAVAKVTKEEDEEELAYDEDGNVIEASTEEGTEGGAGEDKPSEEGGSNEEESSEE
jgi:DNA gyrase subunit A